MNYYLKDNYKFYNIKKEKLEINKMKNFWVYGVLRDKTIY